MGIEARQLTAIKSLEKLLFHFAPTPFLSGFCSLELEGDTGLHRSFLKKQMP